MANPEHVSLLREGVDAWNTWRDGNPLVKPDLTGALLRGAYLRGVNLRGSDLTNADFTGADLSDAQLAEADLLDARFEEATLVQADLQQGFLARAHLWKANLRGANLGKANLRYVNAGHSDFCGATLTGADAWFALFVEANLSCANLDSADFRSAHMFRADLRRASLVRTSFNAAWLDEADLREAKPEGASFDSASLRQANLSGMNLSGVNLSADLIETNLSHADLRGAKLTGMLIRTDLRHANLSGCRVYGVSAWDVETDENTKQTGLIITPEDKPAVIVDDLAVAQLFYLLLDREKIRNVIDTVTRRGVLLLGRFGDGGLVLLQALAEWLRKSENGGYLPLLFDFPRPESRTYTDTVRTLAGLARFVIVDLSGPSVPQEITATVDLYEIPFVPILEQKRKDWSMFRDFLVKERVLKPVRFTDRDHLLKLMAEEVIAPAEKLIEERQQRLDKIFGRA